MNAVLKTVPVFPFGYWVLSLSIFVPPNFDDFLLVAEGLWVDANAFQHMNKLVRWGLVLLLRLLVAACPHKDSHRDTHHQHRGADEASRYW